MSQGFGFGRRADMSDGVFMSGGFGILRDAAGDDDYVCDIFGQGTGYWFGAGILADKEGDDTWKGRWYVMGAAAHMAVGIFLDEGGTDIHNQDMPVMNCSLGCGHDFSLGLMAMFKGSDTYFAPSLAVGAGNADGIGIFLDDGGDDSHSSTANNTFGFANSDNYGAIEGFGALKAIGLFLDHGGKDIYSRPDMTSVIIGDDKMWQNPPAHPDQGEIEKGGGMDNAAMSVGM
jgi:hypothetical protein